MKKSFSNSYRFTCETELVSDVAAFLIDQGFKVKCEVPNMGQSIDLVASDENEVFCVEAKLNNWRKAIDQCRAHRQIADYICIALGTVSVSPALLEEMEVLGYGIIHCSPKTGLCEWVKKPLRNKMIWRPQRTKFDLKMKEVEYVS